jgi:hypothetical protein
MPAWAERVPEADDRLTVVHHVAGRLRLRVPAVARTDGLADTMTALPGVLSAAWSPRTRGLLILYDRAVADAMAIVDAVAEHTGAEPTAPSAPPNGARPTLASAVTALAQDVNARVTRASGGLVTLGVLVPLALTAWAAGEVLRGRTGPLAWSTALWYAHGLFRDYSVSSGQD